MTASEIKERAEWIVMARKDGEDWDEIAMRWSVSPASARAIYCGATSGRGTSAMRLRNEEILSAVEGGQSMYSISKERGLTQSLVRQIVSRERKRQGK